MSDATIKTMLQTLGWTITWTRLVPSDLQQRPANDNAPARWVAAEQERHAA